MLSFYITKLTDKNCPFCHCCVYVSHFLTPASPHPFSVRPPGCVCALTPFISAVATMSRRDNESCVSEGRPQPLRLSTLSQSLFYNAVTSCRELRILGVRVMQRRLCANLQCAFHNTDLLSVTTLTRHCGALKGT